MNRLKFALFALLFTGTAWAGIYGVQQILNVNTVNASALNTATMDASGAVTADSVSATGDVSGATVTASGAVTSGGVNVLSGVDSTGLSSASDLDTISDGWYSWANSVPINAPGGTAYMSLVQMNDGSQPSQLAFGGASPVGEIWGRRKNSGAWSAWTRTWTSANDGSGSGLDADTIDGTAITGSEIWTTSNDGAGSGLDADTIDGTVITGSEIWTASNDGAGSGLDADTVHGYKILMATKVIDMPSIPAGTATAHVNVSMPGVDSDDACFVRADTGTFLAAGIIISAYGSTHVSYNPNYASINFENVSSAAIDLSSHTYKVVCLAD